MGPDELPGAVENPYAPPPVPAESIVAGPIAPAAANSTIQLTFRYAQSDYVRAVQTHHGSRLFLRLDIVIVVVFAGLGAYFWGSPSDHWLGVGCVGVSVGVALALIAAVLVIPRLVFRREPKFRDEYSITFSPEGIHFRTVHIDSQLQWSLYRRALIDRHSYLLYYGWRQFSVIPKRVFQDVEQRQAFERLLEGHIPQIVRRDA